MKCEKAQEVFSEYLERTLEKPMMLALEHHLESCGACGRDYERFRATWEMIDALPEVEVPAGFRESVMAEIRARQTVPAKRAWSFDLRSIIGARIQVRAVAAAAAVVLFGVMLFQTPQFQVVMHDIIGTDLPAAQQASEDGVDEYVPERYLSDPGLNIQINTSTGKDGNLVYGINLKPSTATPINAKAYLINDGIPAFDEKTLDASDVIFNKRLTQDQSGDILVVMKRHSSSSVVYVKWEYNSMPMSEVIFLPADLSGNTTGSADFTVPDTTLRGALQELSNTYGVVILADGSAYGKVRRMELNSDIHGAFYRTLKNSGLRSRQLDTKVFIVERQL